MSTIDEFVRDRIAALATRTSYEDRDLDSLGGQVFIFDGEGNCQYLGLGQISPILDIRGSPHQDQSSDLFQGLLKTNYDIRIFKETAALVPVVTSGVVSVSPSEASYHSIKAKAHNFDEAVDSLDSALVKLKLLEKLATSQEILGKITNAESPETMMQTLIGESIELTSELIHYFPGWMSGVWNIEEPLEYTAVKRSYEDLKSACRNGIYTLNISEKANQSQWIKKVMVRSSESISVPEGRNEFYIVDDIAALEAFANSTLKGGNILYRGHQDEAALSLLRSLDTDHTIIANLRTVKQYVDHVNTI